MRASLKIQLMSDLHLEVETFQPEPHPEADVLVLAGDIDSRWEELALFKSWPVPVVMVAGNHEFDRRDQRHAWGALRASCEANGLHLLECESFVLPGIPEVRFVGCTRWCDFDLLGPDFRDKAMRSAKHYLQAARMSLDGQMLDAAGVRSLALSSRAWLERELRADHKASRTVVVTHFAPSGRSADPRYGLQPGTAGFCNTDEDLMGFADLWLHGHLHCPSDYMAGNCRVVANPRGYVRKQETSGFLPQCLIELDLRPR